jgi:pilus assembly protein FimV
MRKMLRRRHTLQSNKTSRLLGLSLFAYVWFICNTAQAIGLGEIRQQSALGQGFRSNIPLLGEELEGLLPSCIKARVLTLDGALLSILDTAVNLNARPPVLQLSGVARINEPAVMLSIDIMCNVAISRVYQLLLDPPDGSINLPAIGSNPVLNLPFTPLTNIVPDETSPTPAPASRPRKKRSRRVEQAAVEADLPPRPPSGRKRNVLRVAKQNDILPDLAGNLMSPTEAKEELNLLLSRRLSNDNSTLANAEVSAFSETLRKEQNKSILLELEQAELRTLKKQIGALEEELKRTRQIPPSPGTVANVMQSVQSILPTISSGGAAQSTRPWLIGLSAMLLVSLFAIAWLVWRLRSLRSKAPVFSSNAITDEIEHNSITEPPVKPQAVPTPSPSIKPAATKADTSSEKNVEFVFDEKVLSPQLLKSQAAKPEFKPPAKSVQDLQLKPLSNELSSEILFPHEMKTGSGSGVPQVEEFSDVMHEAEFWISLNKPLNAIQVLQAYTAHETIRSPLPWLLLFDLYLKVDEQEGFAVLQRQFHSIFNAKIPDWADYVDAQRHHGLEQMEYLMGRIQSLWLTDDIIPFLEDMLIDDRDGTREGFELGTYQDILLLINIAKELQFGDANDTGAKLNAS